MDTSSIPSNPFYLHPGENPGWTRTSTSLIYCYWGWNMSKVATGNIAFVLTKPTTRVISAGLGNTLVFCNLTCFLRFILIPT